MSAQIQIPLSNSESKHFLSDLKYWSIITAYGLAAAESIKLSPLHLDVLMWLRQDYERNGSTTISHLAYRIETAFVFIKEFY